MTKSERRSSNLKLALKAASPYHTPTYLVATLAYGIRAFGVRYGRPALLIIVFIVPVRAPFPHITHHVIQSPRIGCLLLNRMGLVI
jgi:hypothetical protein